MTIKNEQGHEDELFGFRIQTEAEPTGALWCVKIYRKPSEAGLAPLLVELAQGFGYEGEAFDFGQARLIESDFHAVETEALAEIEAAKTKIDAVKKGRAQLRKDLDCPQMDFSFVAELERIRVQTIGKKKREQTDLEKHIAAKTAKPEAQPGAAP